MARVGRKCKYYTHVEPYLEYIRGWCRDGATDEWLSGKLGVAVSTLNLYKNQFPEFLEALRVTKELADMRVENALYSRAIGCKVVESKTVEYDDAKIMRDANGNNIPKGLHKKKYTTTVEREVAPHPGAAKLWLMHRKKGWTPETAGLIDNSGRDDRELFREALAGMTGEEKIRLLAELGESDA